MCNRLYWGLMFGFIQTYATWGQYTTTTGGLLFGFILLLILYFVSNLWCFVSPIYNHHLGIAIWFHRAFTFKQRNLLFHSHAHTYIVAMNRKFKNSKMSLFIKTSVKTYALVQKLYKIKQRFKNYTWFSSKVHSFIKYPKLAKGSRNYNFKKDSSLLDCLKRTKERIELTEN